MPSQRSRPRPSNTCDQCKRRKLRCDQRRPMCSRCATTPGSRCSYSDNLDPPHADRARQNLHLDRQAAANAGDIVTTATTPQRAVPITDDRIHYLEERLEHLSGLVRSMRDTRADVALGTNEHVEGQTVGREHVTLAQGHTNVADPGFLTAQLNGRVRYVSSAFWARSCEETGYIEELLREQTRYEPVRPETAQEDILALSSTILSSVPSWDTEASQSARSRPVACKRKDLPGRAICDHLLQAYIWNFHPVIPLVHISTLHAAYERFWENRDDFFSTSGMPSDPLIIAVLFAGAVVCTSRDVLDSQTQKHWIISLHRTTSETLRLLSFPRTPTVESLTAYLIIQCTFMREEEPLTTCSFVGVAVRAAQMLGLHKDLQCFQNTASLEVIAEIRRRVWWHIYALDVLVATAAGLPPMIDRNSFEVALPSDVREELWETTQAQPFMGLAYSAESVPGLIETASAGGIFIRCRIRLRVAQRKILDVLDAPLTSETNTAKAMISELEKVQGFLKLHIDRMLQLPTITETYETNRNFMLWASLLLTAMNEKNWSLVQQRLDQQSIHLKTRPASPGIKTRIRSFLRKYIILSCANRFASYQWCWPGNHQPLHALVVLLKDLERDPTASDAVATRKLIDETIALCDTGGGVNSCTDGRTDAWRRPLTEGGREAWDLIKKLRCTIFVKLGLDPDILPTREQVTGLAQRLLEDIEMNPSVLVVGENYILHDTLTMVPTDTLDCPPFTTIADVSAIDFMEESSAVSPSPRFDWNDWNTLFPV